MDLLALEKRRVRGEPHSLYLLLRRGNGKEGPEHLPWHPVIRHMGRVQSNTRRDSDLTLWNLSSLRVWSKNGAGFLAR